MSEYVAIRNGGKTDENGALRFLRRLSSNGSGPVQTGDLAVSQHATPAASVDVAIGDIVIAYQDYCFYGWIDAIKTVTITANSSGNPRIDAIVAYEDLAVVSSASNNNPAALKIIAVAGTPAGSPVVPDATAIQAAVGAGNPYYKLAEIAVANGFTTIVNANVTDKRTGFLLGSGTKAGFFIGGTPSVANDLSWNPPIPQAQTFSKAAAYARTAPTGSSLTIRVYNVTKAQDVVTLSITAGSNFASTTSFTNASVSADDILRIDITAIGSTINGSDISVILS